MIQRKYIMTLALVLLLFALPVGARMLYAGTGVFLVGSNTMVGMVQLLAEAFMENHPDISVSVSGGGSARGIKALNDGVAQIALLSVEHEQNAPGLQLHSLPLALDAVVPVVHPDNKVQTLKVDQLRSIFSGKYTNWRELGGTDIPIMVLSHDRLTGTYEVWKHKVMGESTVITPRAQILETSSIITTVATNSGAIGYVAFRALDKSVRAVAVGGITASPATIRSETFPISRKLLLAIPENASAATISVVDFFLNPLQGGKVLQNNGYIPAFYSTGE